MRSLTQRAAAWIAQESERKPGPAAVEVTALFVEFRSSLLRYAMSLGCDALDGEDIVQEVFLALHRHLSENKPRTNLRGWIFRTGHNLALKRRLAARPSVPIEDAILVMNAPNPEQRLAAVQNREQLNAIVEALPERDRYCLYLKMEGLRYREIAGVLDISLGAVANSLGLTLSKLSVVTAGRKS